jgi:hypothetical protein
MNTVCRNRCICYRIFSGVGKRLKIDLSFCAELRAVLTDPVVAIVTFSTFLSEWRSFKRFLFYQYAFDKPKFAVKSDSDLDGVVIFDYSTHTHYYGHIFK